MNKSIIVSTVALVLLLGVVGYLVFPRNPQGEFNPPGELVFSNPSIESLDLLVMESFPPQINAVIKGVLPDSCFEVYEKNQNLNGFTITLDIRLTKPSEAVCAPIKKTFEEIISIETTNLVPGEYTVIAGNHSKNFEWPETSDQSL